MFHAQAIVLVDSVIVRINEVNPGNRTIDHRYWWKILNAELHYTEYNMIKWRMRKKLWSDKLEE